MEAIIIAEQGAQQPQQDGHRDGSNDAAIKESAILSCVCMVDKMTGGDTHNINIEHCISKKT